MSYIGANELIFNNDNENGIHTGGFSVKSIMMKEGFSPIMTINSEQTGGKGDVSDLFKDLVVPSWGLSYHNKMFGGDHIRYDSDYDIEDNEDDVIEDDLHDKLLSLVKHIPLDEKNKVNKKKPTRKIQNKKGGTKKRIKE